MHTLIKNPRLSFSLALGTIHRDLRIANQFLSRGVRGRSEGDADARTSDHFVRVHLEWQRQPLLDPLGNPYGIAGVANVFKQYGKFITAQPGQPALAEGFTFLRQSGA